MKKNDMMKKQSKRGRPRTFDMDTAMAAIVRTFREKGHAATSLDDLSEATGLTRPSLYAAFGDKLSMYLAALEAFAKQSGEKAGTALQQGRTVEEGLNAFFEEMLTAYFAGMASERGCLIFSTAPGASDRKEVQALLSATIKEIDQTMISKFEALISGDSKVPIKAASEAATHTLIGLSTRARAGSPQKELRQVARRASKLIASVLER